MRSFIIIPLFLGYPVIFSVALRTLIQQAPMKLTLIRTARETGKETFSTWPSDTLMEKMKNREQSRTHIRLAQPHSPHHRKQRTLPLHRQTATHLPCRRICPQQRGGKIPEKPYNGLVQIEVNHLANAVEVEQVKHQAALLPQTFAAFLRKQRTKRKNIGYCLPPPTVRAPGRK